MPARKSPKRPVTENNRGSVRQRGALVEISTETFRELMRLAGVGNQQLADATGVSKGYVGQIRTGRRTRVSQRFLAEAGDYFGRVLGEPGRLAFGLLREPSGDNAGE